jgi:predicted nucleic acid-binding protein
MKVLADTSIWINYLSAGNPEMSHLLKREAIAMHPFVEGELACGNLKDRPGFLARLHLIPKVPLATQEEALLFLESNRLWGLGINWVDLNLLASSRLAGAHLWTRDKAMHKAAEALRIAFYS